MLKRCSFDEEENEFEYYRGRDCIDKLCKKLKEHAMKIINYEKKEMIQLTVEENRSCDEEVCLCTKEVCLCTNKHNENYKNKKS